MSQHLILHQLSLHLPVSLFPKTNKTPHNGIAAFSMRPKKNQSSCWRGPQRCNHCSFQSLVQTTQNPMQFIAWFDHEPGKTMRQWHLNLAEPLRGLSCLCYMALCLATAWSLIHRCIGIEAKRLATSRVDWKLHNQISTSEPKSCRALFH